MLALAHIAAAALLSFALVELALRLPLAQAARGVLEPMNRARHVMSTSRISDHWKEKVLLVYARRTLAGVAALLCVMAALLVPAAALTFVLDIPLPGFVAFMVSLLGITITCASAGLYLKLRRWSTDVRV